MATKFITSPAWPDDCIVDISSLSGMNMLPVRHGSGNTGSYVPAPVVENATKKVTGIVTATGSTLQIIDTERLKSFGNNQLKDIIILITSGNCNGEKKIIASNTLSTGTLVVDSAFSQVLAIGDTYEIVTYIQDVSEYKLEITDGNSTGQTGPEYAAFKYSRDDGVTYYGAKDINEANWDSRLTVNNTIKQGSSVVSCQTSNGDLITLYQNNSDSIVKKKISNDWGKCNFSAASNFFGTLEGTPKDMILLNNGHVLAVIETAAQGNELFAVTKTYRSLDHGATWALRSAYAINSFRQLDNGNIIGVYTYNKATGTSFLYCAFSSDEGASWGSIETIESSSDNHYYNPVVRFKTFENPTYGNEAVVYEQKVIATSARSLRRARRVFGGWLTDEIQSGDCFYPCLVERWNGYLGLFYVDNANTLWYTQEWPSQPWSTRVSIISDAVNGVSWPHACRCDGHFIICNYNAGTANDAIQMKHGQLQVGQTKIWLSRTPDFCPIYPQVKIHWTGGNAVVGDTFEIEFEFLYTGESIYKATPQMPWRSATDESDEFIVLDANGYHIDGILVMNTNVRTLKFEANDIDNWSNPVVSCELKMDKFNGEVISDAAHGGNPGTPNTYKIEFDETMIDHKYIDYCLMITSGVHNGVSVEILDNTECQDGTGTWIYFNSASSLTLAVGTTVTLLEKNRAFTGMVGKPCKYIRIAIPSQKTPHGYYQLASLLGYTTILPIGFQVGYSHTLNQNLSFLGSNNTPVVDGEPRREFSLTFDYLNGDENNLTATANYLRGKKFCFIPFGHNHDVPVAAPDTPEELAAYLVRMINNVDQNHHARNWMTGSIKLVESN
jgi:hypothetical protein